MDELYLLTCLSEECAEVIQACAKAQRFGPHDFWPEQGKTNAEAIIAELVDVMAIVEMLRECGVLKNLTPFDYINRQLEKQARVRQYLEEAKRRAAKESA